MVFYGMALYTFLYAQRVEVSKKIKMLSDKLKHLGGNLNVQDRKISIVRVGTRMFGEGRSQSFEWELKCLEIKLLWGLESFNYNTLLETFYLWVKIKVFQFTIVNIVKIKYIHFRGITRSDCIPSFSLSIVLSLIS